MKIVPLIEQEEGCYWVLVHIDQDRVKISDHCAEKRYRLPYALFIQRQLEKGYKVQIETPRYAVLTLPWEEFGEIEVFIASRKPIDQRMIDRITEKGKMWFAQWRENPNGTEI